MAKHCHQYKLFWYVCDGGSIYSLRVPPLSKHCPPAMYCTRFTNTLAHSFRFVCNRPALKSFRSDSIDVWRRQNLLSTSTFVSESHFVHSLSLSQPFHPFPMRAVQQRDETRLSFPSSSDERVWRNNINRNGSRKTEQKILWCKCEFYSMCQQTFIKLLLLLLMTTRCTTSIGEAETKKMMQNENEPNVVDRMRWQRLNGWTWTANATTTIHDLFAHTRAFAIFTIGDWLCGEKCVQRVQVEYLMAEWVAYYIVIGSGLSRYYDWIESNDLLLAMRAIRPTLLHSPRDEHLKFKLSSWMCDDYAE